MYRKQTKNISNTIYKMYKSYFLIVSSCNLSTGTTTSLKKYEYTSNKMSN